MIINSYLHIPQQFTRSSRSPIVFNGGTELEETYLYWRVDPKETDGDFADYFTIPINHQEVVAIDENYNYSDISVSLMASDNFFKLMLEAANKLLVIVDFDSIPRTPFISSSSRLAGANAWNLTLSLKPFNCYRIYKGDWEVGELFYKPSSEYVSYKALQVQNGEVRFDPQYSLLKTQTEVA